MTTNIFEQAVKSKLRFQSDRGDLTTEQLYDLSLINLDSIARSVNKELKDVSEESFIDLKPNTVKTTLELQLEILKYVIQDKLKEKDDAEQKAVRAAKRRTLLEALNNKENEELNSMSKEDILKELDALDK